MSKYTKIPNNTFKELQINTGILLSDFTPSTGAFDMEDMLGATTGGISFKDDISFIDFGEDIDNAPKNTMELKRIDQHDVKMSGNFVSITDALANRLVGAGVLTTTSGVSKITPQVDLDTTYFSDVWWVGDYSDQNNGNNAGYVAIHLMNALNTGGFSMQSADKEKTQWAFEFTGHFSIDNQDEVPFEVYIKSGTASSSGTGGT